MAPTPPSTTPSSQGHSPETQFRVVRKRNRIPLSCGPCRHRKLKCNRGHPCDNCIKRSDVDSCTYASPNVRRRPANDSSTSTSDEMQNRIDRLETLVLTLMTNGPQSAGPLAAVAALAETNPGMGSSMSGSSASFPIDADREMLKGDIAGSVEGDESEIDRVAESIGVMKVDNNKAFFVPEAHWYSILAEISEVKNWFQDHKKQYDEQYRRLKADQSEEDREGLSFLLATPRPTSKAEVLREFPTKQTCDTLISRFFNTFNHDPAFHIIHGPTFQRQYDTHWMNPNETQVIWLGLVYAMMVVALQSYERCGDEPPEYRGHFQQMMRDYRRLTAQCLLLADITQPIDHMLETLLLCTLAESGRGRDQGPGILLGVSVIVRLALKMGYHRDSKYYPAISPFAGEMRRRVWTVIRQTDLLFSSQAGQPPTIRARDTNTELPRNLYDDELYEDMKVLPPSRPMTDPTPMCYVIYKAQLLAVFGDIVDLVQAVGSCSYDEVMKLDQQLHETQANMPPIFKMRSVDEVLQDPPALVIQRYMLHLLFLRCQIVLHRKFLCPSRENSRYAYSCRVAIEASMETLEHQAILHHECKPGGRLSNVRWIISCLASQDFLLAAMVVALDLHNTAEAERTSRTTSDACDWPQERRASMLTALEQSLSIWSRSKGESMEALKATGVLEAILSKLRPHEARLRAQRGSASGSCGTFGVGGDDSNVAPEHSAAMTLGMLSTGALTPNTANMFAAYEANNGHSAQAAAQAAASTASSSAAAGLAPSFSNPSTEQGLQLAAQLNPSGPLFGLFPNGMTLGFSNMDIPSGGGIDWDAWDSYMTNATIDSVGNPGTNSVAGNMWMMNMDATPPPAASGLFLDTPGQPSSSGGELDPRMPHSSMSTEHSSTSVPTINATTQHQQQRHLSLHQQPAPFSNSSLTGANSSQRNGML